MSMRSADLSDGLSVGPEYDLIGGNCIDVDGGVGKARACASK